MRININKSPILDMSLDSLHTCSKHATNVGMPLVEAMVGDVMAPAALRPVLARVDLAECLSCTSATGTSVEVASCRRAFTSSACACVRVETQTFL